MATGTTAVQTIDVVTPAAGESVTEGTILEWHAKVGDFINLDDTIVEISTDKVDVELPSPASGTVSEILVEEGETVTVGQVIARISVNGAAPNGAPEAPASSAPQEPDGASPAAEGPTDAEPSTAASSGQIVDVLTPAAGESVTEGTILEWRVQAGDFIKADDTIVEISTDKVDLELPAPASGTVTEILVAEGDTVTVGQVIARIAANSAPQTQSGDGNSAGTSAAQSPPADDSAAELAAGTKVSSDVLSAAAGNGAAHGDGATNGKSSVQADQRTELLKGGAAALARYMEQSRSIPTATSFRTLTVTMLDARRRELKAAGRKVSFTHVIAYAIARAGDRRQAAPCRGRPSEPGAGRGRGEEGRLTDADGPGDRGCKRPALRGVPGGIRRAGGEGAHEHADRG
jgi:2-oxoglutarate decarboxylase